MLHKKTVQKGVRETLLMGVFWRILFIEGVLLVFSLGYKWYTEDATSLDLFWYSIRITLFVIVIVVFMMVTLRKFLTQKIIDPLEAIALSNKKIKKDIHDTNQVDMPENFLYEIENIVTTRSKMLDTIIDISEERLKYSTALNDELERGKQIQKDFLPRHLPDVKKCQISSYFHSALQLSGDFYDVFELPDNHVGFVIGDVSGKGVGSALFMALTRSLLRIFSGDYKIGNDACTFSEAGNPWTPDDALDAVNYSNEYIAKEHGDNGMFVTLFFGIIDPLSGKLFYVNGGHEPLYIIGKNGIKQSLAGTGPAIGPIEGASYKTGTIQLETGDLLFAYTDGVTEARSETKTFYSRARLENIMNKGFDDSTEAFLELVKADLFKFIGSAEQSDDITMLALKWNP